MKAGRIIGIVIFAVGMAALIFVFTIAYRMFTLPASQLFAAKGAASSALTAAGLGSATVLIFVRIALLFIMTLAAALIASRGIQLYLGCGERVIRDEVEVAPKK